MIPSYYEFHNAVKVISGKKALENIPFELKNLGGKKPLILTTKSLLRNGQVQIVVDSFYGFDIEPGPICKDIPPDSSVEIVNEIGKLYRETNCDSIIAMGGGSVLDTAKGVNILVSKDSKDIMEFMGLEVIEGKLRPLIAVPSTSGTGSESTLVAVIANPEKKVKMEFISYNILPDVAVLDSRMTLSLPVKMTASTGMDALVHAIEGYTSIQKNPLSDAYAFASIDLIREYLIKTVKDGQNEENRLAMANASFMAGAAFSNSMVGIVHAIGHACGGVSHVPHGDAMTILLPHGMEYNLHKVEESYEKLLLPLGGAELYARTPKDKRAEKAIEVVKNMIKELNNLCGLPIRLRDAGVLEEDFTRIAKTALNDGAALANPVEVSYESIMNILKNAY